MFRRPKGPDMTTELEAERQRLVARVQRATAPPSTSAQPSVAERAVQGDRAMLQRAQDALSAGWIAPSLDGVPLHRRAQVVEDGLDVFDAMPPGGCAWCGVRKPDAAPWCVREGRQTCQSCNIVMDECGRPADFAIQVITAAAGLRGVPYFGGVEAPVFAHEYPLHPSGDRWTHLTRSRRQAIRDIAAAKFGANMLAWGRLVGRPEGFTLRGLPPAIEWTDERHRAAQAYREQVRADVEAAHQSARKAHAEREVARAVAALEAAGR